MTEEKTDGEVRELRDDSKKKELERKIEKLEAEVWRMEQHVLQVQKEREGKLKERQPLLQQYVELERAAAQAKEAELAEVKEITKE